jgi:hypothetical protein
MLLRGLLNLLILPIIVKFSTSQYPPCYICGPDYGIANPANYVAFQDGTYKTCSTVESEALYGYYTEAYCSQYQPSFQQMCGCEAIEAPPTSPQQPPTAPATAPQQPPTAPVTAPQQPHSAPTTASPPSTSNVGAIVGYVVAGLFGVGFGAGLFNFYNTGTCNIFNFNFNK